MKLKFNPGLSHSMLLWKKSKYMIESKMEISQKIKNRWTEKPQLLDAINSINEEVGNGDSQDIYRGRLSQVPKWASLCGSVGKDFYYHGGSHGF